MTSGFRLLAFITLQRAAELAIATRNTRRLRRDGAYEAGATHYPLMVGMHASWLATLWLYGRTRTASRAFVAAFVLLQAARLWVLATLGARWTTRIIIVPGARPIVHGPFRFVRHPNYLVVALELPCVALALGLRSHALVFGVANLLMLGRRIGTENAAFAAEAERASQSAEPVD